MSAVPSTDRDNTPGYSLWQMVLYMLRLGTFGFGGPVALVGYMHRDLVERRRWITESDYTEGLALAQLAPGPMAAQTALYLGYVHYRILGATLAGLAFVIPSFLMVVALGWAYSRFGGLTWMQAVFYGVGAAVIGIIAISAHKLTKKSVGQDKLLWAIYLTVAAVTVINEAEIAGLFLAAGIIEWLWRVPPKRLTGGGHISPRACPTGAGERLAHHGGLHRLSGGGLSGGLCGRAGHVFAVLSVYRDPRALLQEIRQVARHRGLCGWRHRSSSGRHHRLGHRDCQALHRGRSNRAHGLGNRGFAREVQKAAGARCRHWCCPDRSGALSLAASLISLTSEGQPHEMDHPRATQD